MCANDSKKEDIRITKTHNALKTTLLSLLGRRSFGKITVNDLCEEALVSRTAFYANFVDKYDLLQCCMDDIKKMLLIYTKGHTEKQIIAKVNDFIYDHSTILVNLVDDANSELIKLLTDILSPDLWHNLSSDEKESRQMTDSHVILTRFYAGGMANLLLWQIRSNFPVDKDMMTEYLYQMLKNIKKWDLEQE